MLVVHRSERADRLVEALGDLLSAPLPDPVVPEVVAVPTRGVERWLTQRLSHRLGAPPSAGGVCANLRFPFPGTLVGEATAAACGVDGERDPWRPERAVWPLVEVIDEGASDEVLRPLTEHLRAATPPAAGDQGEPVRRFATARHLADLFDHYAIHRPQLVLGWAAGTDGGAAGDPSAVWQAHLWRLLRHRLGVPSPAERFASAAELLAAGRAPVDLPGRLSLFGLTRLPASHLQVLEALGTERDVHLFLLHPSGRLWAAVAAAYPSVRPALPRAEDPTARVAANPLLRSWGRDAREMQLVLAGAGVTASDHRPVDDGPDPAPTLLRRLQDDVRADRSPPGRPAAGQPDERAVLDPGDRSVQVHACHGRSRQVEVVRDAILHLLADDPTLELRDVIVMCPDIETFAPLVHAAFGADDPDADGTDGDGLGMPRLRVRLADRSLRQTNPLLGVAAQLLVLAGSRLTASQVLDLASRPPVARRFRLDQDDLTTFERWVEDAGIRWGLDAEHRRPWHLQRVATNTWSSGLDRLLLGLAMSGEGAPVFGHAVPS
ncbi:MAG TPA: exodeoxyribonuclease V subunit gamma [Acidimicrobiales bacterium]|nr:exodeoxyribonuclease V subunit gamma [Acidimicrobiales bacterium]